MEEMNLQDKLLNAQAELKAPKNLFNSFGKYKYRNAESILEAAKPVNKKYGLTMTISDEIINVGERYYIKAEVSISDGKEKQVVSAYAREAEEKRGMDASQITGTASSYARKYALNGLYLIDDTKDADTDEYQSTTRKQDNFKPITQKQVGSIKTKAKQFAELRGQEESAVYKALKISDITKLSADMASKTITTLDSWIEKAGKQ